MRMADLKSPHSWRYGYTSALTIILNNVPFYGDYIAVIDAPDMLNDQKLVDQCKFFKSCLVR